MDWNRERRRTRDRLLKYYGGILPAPAHSNSIGVIYPWEEMNLVEFEHEFYNLASKHGYEGSPASLWEVMFKDSSIITGTIHTFPMPGDPNLLYLDIETDILYYFKRSVSIDIEQAAENGAYYIQNNDVYYVYIPVRALLIEDTILNCGHME